MQALKKLGLEFQEEIPLNVLLNENFNGNLYGMTKTQQSKLKALREVVVEYNKLESYDSKEAISDSRKAVKVVYGMLKDLGHEEVWVAFLTKSNVVISAEMLFKGSLDTVVISPKTIIAKALSCNAASVIMYHNHPSGVTYPSTNDIKQTQSLKKACQLMEINLLDHIIISKGEYYSFAEEEIIKIKK